jgi:hypothetical protein
MRFEHKLFPLGCQEMIAKGSHIRDGGAAEEALKPQLSGFQVSSLRGHGELGKEPIGADRKMRRGAGPHYSSLTAQGTDASEDVQPRITRPFAPDRSLALVSAGSSVSGQPGETCLAAGTNRLPSVSNLRCPGQHGFQPSAYLCCLLSVAAVSDEKGAIPTANGLARR